VDLIVYICCTYVVLVYHEIYRESIIFPFSLYGIRAVVLRTQKYLMSGDEDQRFLEQNRSSMSFRTSKTWENSNHPLFLHHADQPGAILVSQMLMEDNYTTWVQSMSMALTIKNKKGFVDGTLRRPTHNSNEQQQWDRCDILVRTWLLGSMSKDISSSVIHCKDARGIWLELKERFSQTNTVSLFHIENVIHDCEQGTNSVTTFFTKLKCLWDEKDALNSFPPCNCEVATTVKTFLETQKTMKFLMGLNESYAQTRSNIISMDPLPNLNKAYAMVLRHEKQAETFTGKLNTPPEASAFTIKKVTRDFASTNGEIKFYEKCNMNNHNTKNCRAHLKCTYCNGKGHTYDYCRRRRNATAGGQGRSKANHVAPQNHNKEDLPEFPFSREECHQLLSQLLANTKSASANLVGNIPNYEELSGPTIGEDDWDGH